MRKPTVLIAGDYRLVLDGLCRILGNDFDVLGTVENGLDLVETALQTNPDIILTEISIPLLNGIDACRRLCQVRRAAKILIVTVHSDADIVREAFRAGASGYILQRCSSEELIKAIYSVLDGCAYVTPLIAKHVVASLDDSLSAHRADVFGLTRRQREILQLVAEGRSTKQMADILNISPRTVEFHKSALSRALDLHTTAALTRYAIEHGLGLSIRQVPVAGESSEASGRGGSNAVPASACIRSPEPSAK